MTFAPRRSAPELWREGAGQKIDKGGLARAIGPDDADPVAAHDAKRKIAHDWTIAIGLADPFGVDHQRARRFGVLRDHGGDADRSQGFAPVAPELGKLAHPSHIALAARGHAIAHPMLFIDDLPFELVALELLLLELLVAPGLEGAETSIETARAATIEPDRRAGQVGKQPLVVADERQRRAALGETRFEPFDRDQVEVIGRLIQQQNVRLLAQSPDKRCTPRFSAGEAAGISGRIKPELGQHRPRRIGIVKFVKPCEHIVQRRLKARHVRLLR